MSAAAAIRIIVNGVPSAALSPNASRMQHWGTKTRARNELAFSAWAAAYDVRPEEPIEDPVSVTVRVCWPKGRKRMDVDNLTACLKPMLDAFTRSKIWNDDKQVQQLDVQQERLDKAGLANWPGGCVVVDIEEVTR